MVIVKRDGRVETFDPQKIQNAIKKAFVACNLPENPSTYQLLTHKVEVLVKNKSSVEDIQDIVEKVLMTSGFPVVAKQYILYRNMRSNVRDSKTSIMEKYREIVFTDAKDSEVKRENANIDGNTAMGSMLKFGSEGAKEFYKLCVIPPEISEAHANGDIHIHDMDFYTLTTTCTQIETQKVLKDGFNTGHGFLREPQSIQSYAALACIAIQANQNDQHGGQAIADFDYGMAPGVVKTYIKELVEVASIRWRLSEDRTEDLRKTFSEVLKEGLPYSILSSEGDTLCRSILYRAKFDPLDSDYIISKAKSYTDKATYQAMESLIHNLNTMHSRAGAQTPFSSLNYGMATSPEARMVIKNLLLATEAGLGNGETPIFPIQIFRMKEGINLNPGDPNYDLFQLACRVTAKRMFPNFSNQDAPFNLQYYKGTPETEIGYMGCRTRVMANIANPDKEITYGRGNLSFTSINLPRLAIKAGKGNFKEFYDSLDKMIDLVVEQLLHRFRIQCSKTVRNYPFLMGNGVWIDSEELSVDDTLEEVLKNGTLSVGFIGLAETLVALTGHHHGEGEEYQKLGLEIISHMREKTDWYSQKYKLNFTLLATPAEGLSGRFVRMDKKLFGEIPGVTDRDYYTNSFHIPVYFPISAAEKIHLEAPYHALTNAGHITYVELDGDPSENVEAVESLVRYMHDEGIGYGSINHPLDRDPVCGYTGIIEDVCPRCGRREGEAVSIKKLIELRKKYPNMPKICGCE